MIQNRVFNKLMTLTPLLVFIGYFGDFVNCNTFFKVSGYPKGKLRLIPTDVNYCKKRFYVNLSTSSSIAIA